MKILLTGATGLIGQRIVRNLYQEGHEIFVLVRPISEKKARDIFKDLPQLHFIAGDIEDTDVVKNIDDINQVLDVIDCVVHLAARYDLTSTHTDCYFQNVLGTQNVLRLLRKMKSLTHFHYFSTYAVNPISHGVVNEDFLVGEMFKFPDAYSRTKNYAENLIRKETNPQVKFVIHRPGIIIGDSKTGKMEKTDGPYYLFDFALILKFLSTIKIKIPYLPMPLREDSLLPVLPVDILAQWSSHIIMNPPGDKLKCYHLVPKHPIKTVDFLEASLELLGTPTQIVPLGKIRTLSKILPLIKVPRETAFYMKQQTIFNQSHFESDYPELSSPPCRQYLPKIIKGYLKGRS